MHWMIMRKNEKKNEKIKIINKIPPPEWIPNNCNIQKENNHFDNIMFALKMCEVSFAAQKIKKFTD